jgi:hypothetical protein
MRTEGLTRNLLRIASTTPHSITELQFVKLDFCLTDHGVEHIVSIAAPRGMSVYNLCLLLYRLQSPGTISSMQLLI